LRQYNVAVDGSRSSGKDHVLEILEERKFPVKSLKLLATSRSAGRSMQFRGEEYTIEETYSLAIILWS
jgi:aspartate-semialdehyde dehydrogenase